jgi:Na+-translocating ferredoxin:NAD+ oxidoreductase subunit B
MRGRRLDGMDESRGQDSGVLSRRLAVANADQIDALLPQTQCTKCGFGGCRPYAEAVAAGTADIDRCPPGGQAGVERLALLLGRAPKPLDPVYGRETPRSLAWIDERACIGCTLCIQACPTDAIVGAAKQMHTVVLHACTGCELCVAPCPVDCIDILPLAALVQQGAAGLQAELDVPVATHADRWRSRYAARGVRLAREREERDHRLAVKAEEKLRMLDSTPDDPQRGRKRAAVQAAIERARARAAANGK